MKTPKPRPGRRHLPAGMKRRRVSITLSPSVADRLAIEPNGSVFIEAALLEKWARVDRRDAEK